MKNSFKIFISILLVVILIVLVLNLNYNDNKISKENSKSPITGNVIENSQESEAKPEIDIQLTNTKFIHNIKKDEKHFMFREKEDDEEINQLIVKGALINNKEESLKDFSVKARFYNSLTENQELNIINDGDFQKITNKYIELNKVITNEGSSLNPFHSGTTFFTVIFDDVPSYSNEKDYLPRGSLKNKDWIRNNYDIDKVELIFYHNKTKIKTINLDLPLRYTSDMVLNVTGMNWIYRGGHRVYLDSLTFNILNKEQKILKEPNLKINACELESGDQMSNITLDLSDYNLNNENNFIRFIAKDDYPMKFYFTELNHIIDFELYDGKELIDRDYFKFNCPKRVEDESLDFPCLIKTPWVYEIEDSGINIQIGELYTGVKGDNYIGTEIKIKKITGKETIKMNDPIIEFVCGNSWIYEFDESQFGNYIPLDFGEGAFCLEPQVFLRERNSPLTYASNI